MIKWLNHRPHEFKHLEEEHRYLAVFIEKGDTKTLCAFVAIRVDTSTRMGVVHVNPIRKAWSHTALKQMKMDWPKVVATFRDMGARRIIATSTLETEHFSWWERFIRHFGFPKATPVYVSQQEV